MFHRYVSLGNNCECAFQMRRVLGRDSSSFFSWNVTSLEALSSLMSSRFADILREENLKNEPQKGLLFDSSHAFYIHSPFKSENFREEAGYGKALDGLRAKFDYLKEKFYAGVPSGHKTVYFYKTEDDGELTIKLSAIRDLLAQVQNGEHFELVVLQPENRRRETQPIEHVHRRYMARLAPWEDATDGHVSSWDKVFREFPHADAMHFAGY